MHSIHAKRRGVESSGGRGLCCRLLFCCCLAVLHDHNRHVIVIGTKATLSVRAEDISSNFCNTARTLRAAKEKGFFIPTPLEKGELGYDMISQLPYFYPNSPKAKVFFIPHPLEKGDVGYDMISHIPYFYPRSPLQETSVQSLKLTHLLALFTGS